MIREVKIKKTKNKKIAKFKNNKKNSISKYEGKKTKYNVNHNHNQKGGNKEKFEIVKLADIDYSQFTLSKYVATDIDWGDSPGKPPTTCCIL